MTIDPEAHELTAVLARLPVVPRCRVVEIGCGDGRLTRRYSARVESVLAIDPDEALVAAFRAAGVDANVDVRAMPVEQLQLPDESVDAVLFSWAL
jgi:16S rRNA A1518/A1519 N6-dimethyltransferase RsmA/KsgA/DIM1 with predicted DNA glycosylase/AP lyase activity